MACDRVSAVVADRKWRQSFASTKQEKKLVVFFILLNKFLEGGCEYFKFFVRRVFWATGVDKGTLRGCKRSKFKSREFCVYVMFLFPDSFYTEYGITKDEFDTGCF